jgi:hypothetical protein
MPVTLCGKCGKQEPGCDCRPLAIPESGNARRNSAYANLNALLKGGKLYVRGDCGNLIEELQGYRWNPRKS